MRNSAGNNSSLQQKDDDSVVAVDEDKSQVMHLDIGEKSALGNNSMAEINKN